MLSNYTSRLFLLSNNLVRPSSIQTLTHKRMSSMPPNPATTTPVIDFGFSASPIPKNPLGEGRYIKTAAALIIG